MKQPQQEAHQETQIEIQPPTNMPSYAKKCFKWWRSHVNNETTDPKYE